MAKKKKKKKPISLGSKVAHGYARTVPPGDSMLAEVRVLPRVPGPSRAVLVWGYFHKHTLCSSICHPLSPRPGIQNQLQIFEAEVWKLFFCGFHHPGDPASSTFMMRKTDTENNRLLCK